MQISISSMVNTTGSWGHDGYPIFSDTAKLVEESKTLNSNDGLNPDYPPGN